MLPMDQTTLLAAGMGLAGVILAALAGFGGAILGSRVAAAATREAPQRAQAEAQADREEARRARFADRIRELSAGLLGTTSRVLVDVGDQLEFRHRRPTDRAPVVQMDIPRLVQDAQELGLLVRSGPATESIDPLVQAVLGIGTFAMSFSTAGAYRVGLVQDDQLARFEAARRTCAIASVVFGQAIRHELGTGGMPISEDIKRQLKNGS